VRSLWLLCLVSLLTLACGEDKKERRVETPPPPAAEERASDPTILTDDAPGIDPDKEELYRTGHPVDRLLAKYDLLVERILLERKEGTYNIPRTVDEGLEPIAGEHHDLLAEGVIDTTLALQFVDLAVFVLRNHVLEQKDPFGEEVRARIERIHEMIPEHAARITAPEGIPEEPRRSPPPG